MSPGGKLKSNGWRKFVKKMGYGHEINSNHLLESFKRADHVPIPHALQVGAYAGSEKFLRKTVGMRFRIFFFEMRIFFIFFSTA